MKNFLIPTLKEAQNFLEEGGRLNPGPWVSHSIFVGKAAAAIAGKHSGLDSETAYILGCLHDIGRRVGITSMRHAIDGYNFLSSLNFSDAARICITHSFPLQNINAVFGEWDCTDEELQNVRTILESTKYDDYDMLIQLCDAIALPSGFSLIEKRLVDVALRHGVNEFTVLKWKAIFEIQKRFEEKIGCSIYSLLPGVVENTFNSGKIS
jgi:Predicted HD superfamily hydrolase involved in NAD metabolism